MSGEIAKPVNACVLLSSVLCLATGRSFGRCGAVETSNVLAENRLCRRSGPLEVVGRPFVIGDEKLLSHLGFVFATWTIREGFERRALSCEVSGSLDRLPADFSDLCAWLWWQEENFQTASWQFEKSVRGIAGTFGGGRWGRIQPLASAQTHFPPRRHLERR